MHGTVRYKFSKDCSSYRENIGLEERQARTRKTTYEVTLLSGTEMTGGWTMMEGPKMERSGWVEEIYPEKTLIC